MNEAERLTAFLDATAKRDLKAYADNFLRKLSRKMTRFGGSITAKRAISVDEKTFELVVVDTIETRICGPQGTAGQFDA